MSKYDSLFRHLCNNSDSPIEMTFDEIERLIGPLPASASLHQAWWQNDADGTHVQAKAWINAGREVTHVDRPGRRVAFSVARWRRGS